MIHLHNELHTAFVLIVICFSIRFSSILGLFGNESIKIIFAQYAANAFASTNVYWYYNLSPFEYLIIMPSFLRIQEGTNNEFLKVYFSFKVLYINLE